MLLSLSLSLRVLPHSPPKFASSLRALFTLQVLGCPGVQLFFKTAMSNISVSSRGLRGPLSVIHLTSHIFYGCRLYYSVVRRVQSPLFLHEVMATPNHNNSPHQSSCATPKNVFCVVGGAVSGLSFLVGRVVFGGTLSSPSVHFSINYPSTHLGTSTSLHYDKTLSNYYYLCV